MNITFWFYDVDGYCGYKHSEFVPSIGTKYKRYGMGLFRVTEVFCVEDHTGALDISVTLEKESE